MTASKLPLPSSQPKLNPLLCALHPGKQFSIPVLRVFEPACPPTHTALGGESGCGSSYDVQYAAPAPPQVSVVSDRLPSERKRSGRYVSSLGQGCSGLFSPACLKPESVLGRGAQDEAQPLLTVYLMC